MPIIYGIRPEELGDRGAFVLSDFGRSVNPIPTGGTNYARHITTCPPPPFPGFWDFPPALWEIRIGICTPLVAALSALSWGFYLKHPGNSNNEFA